MREIKFRVWDKLNKKMNTNITRLQLPHDESIERLYGTVLMQFTGLLDKNGKEIYEGDIVKMPNWTPGLYSIEFVEGGFCLMTPTTRVGTDINFTVNNNCEIIGNIYSNPELLKS